MKAAIQGFLHMSTYPPALGSGNSTFDKAVVCFRNSTTPI